MSEDPPVDDREPDSIGIDSRQLLLVGLAVFALVLAAFFAPAATPAPGIDEPNEERTDGETDGGLSFEWYRLFEWLLPELEPEPTDEHHCAIVLDPEPEPGAEVTARVTYDEEPLADAPVWFDGERIGTTDENGEVTGEVPYTDELSIRVAVRNRPDCVATGNPGGTRGVSMPPLAAAASVTGGPTTTGTTLQPDTESDSNATVSYPVNANIGLDIVGEPYPGETLTVRATLNDGPFPGATVHLNGEPAGETGAGGELPVTVPDDGTERLDIRIVRGDLSESVTVDVLLLDVALTTHSLALVPGGDADIEASFAERPAEDAVVTVDGERVGTTDEDGQLAVTLPTDPTASIDVSARDQTAGTSVAAQYRLLAVVVGFLYLLAAGVAYWQRGRRGVVTVTAVTGSVFAAALAVVFADAFYGPTGRYLALGAIASLVLGSALVAGRDTVASGAETTKGWLGRLAARLRAALGALRSAPRSPGGLAGWLRELVFAAAIRVAGALERLSTALGRSLHSAFETVRSLPRSVSGLLSQAAAWLVRLAGRLAHVVRARPLLVTGATVGMGVLLAGGYGVAGGRGTALAAVVVVTAWLLARWYVGRDAGRNDVDTAVPSHGTEPTAGRTDSVADRSFRELWRAFARRVAPEDWRTKTPDEVSRAAIEQGYPRKPVEELTTLFSEVEYGGRTLSSAIRKRAADAYASLRNRGGES